MESVNGTFTIQVHDDGIFLLVTKPADSGAPVEVGQVLDALAERKMTVFDRAAVEEVVRHKAGIPAKIAEIPKKTAEISVLVSRDRMEAFLQMDLPEDANKPDTEAIMERIREAGVHHGVLEEALVLAMRQPGLRVLCARGTPPENGVDAKIEVLVDMSNKGKPIELADGSVDFKNIGMYIDVAKGQILAQKIPATQGVPGSDVLGNPVLSRPGRDVPLQPGANLQVVDNKLVATAGGNLVVNGGKMSVSLVLQVKSDVDLSTGNIEFAGDVMVQGSVQEGFYVKAGGNVDIAGVVSGGAVEGANVTVRLGIMGMNRGKISASGNVVAKFIENATVEAGQDILVTDVVLHSRLSAGNKIRVEGKRGQILGGVTAAGKEIVAKSVGTSSNIETEMQAGVNPKLREEYLRLRKEIKPLEDSADQMQKGLSIFRTMDLNMLTPEKKEMLLKLTRNQFVTKGQIEAKRNRLCELETELEELKGGQIRIADYVFPGVKVVIGSLMKPIQEIARYVTYYADGGDIRIRPFK